MITTQDFDTLPGRNVKGTDGDKIGKVQDVYASTDDSSPTFITVSTGMFGGKASFVPVAEASLTGDDLVVPYSKDQVKDAPNVDTDEELTAEEEDRLYTHYNLSGAAGTTGVADTTGVAETTDTPRTGTATTGDDTITRSEEQMKVGVTQQETGRARLVKHVVTEQQQQTVPVSHEEVRVVREPISGDEARTSNDGTELSEEAAEVTLTEEVPVVTTETRPVERVRLDTETVTDEETVKGEVRKEVIETEGTDRT